MHRRLSVAALVLALGMSILATACSDDESSDRTTTTTTEAPAADPTTTTTTEPEGPLVQATMGPDVSLEVEPETCTIDGGEGEASAEELQVTVESESTAHITWTTEAGSIDLTVPVTIDGAELRAAGAIADGTPYTVTIFC